MIRRIALLCVVLAAPVFGQTTLNGAGATFPNPMYQKWFSEYHKSHPDIQFNYQSIGSGGGIRQVLAQTVDFGASDGPHSPCRTMNPLTTSSGACSSGRA